MRKQSSVIIHEIHNGKEQQRIEAASVTFEVPIDFGKRARENYKCTDEEGKFKKSCNSSDLSRKVMVASVKWPQEN